MGNYSCRVEPHIQLLKDVEEFRRKFKTYSDMYRQFEEELSMRIELLKHINNDIRRCQRIEDHLQHRLIRLNQKYRDREKYYEHLELICIELVENVDRLEQEYFDYQSRFPGNS